MVHRERATSYWGIFKIRGKTTIFIIGDRHYQAIKGRQLTSPGQRVSRLFPTLEQHAMLPVQNTNLKISPVAVIPAK